MPEIDGPAAAPSAERSRLSASPEWDAPWRKWGPYLSERQWGTVREDYSENGDAWNHFPHDHARSRAYHWGEDGLAGFSDLKQRLCFAVALWNGNDPILKERLFGLSNGEGNHGEDVKEYYFYLDSTPTHSYMKWLYKYPHAAFPYADLIESNARRTRQDYEYELIDTGVFDEDRYFDVVVEYAKSSPEECFIKITVTNRGPETATIDVLPTLWFRNTWSWWSGPEKPILTAAKAPRGTSLVAASHPELGARWFYCDDTPSLLFTENETNAARLFAAPNASRIRERRVPCFRGERRHGRRQPCAGRHQGRCPLPSRGRRRPVGVGAAVPHRYAGHTAICGVRHDARRQAPGGRRVLSDLYARVRERGYDRDHAPGLCRPVLDQAVLLLRRQHVAPRARRESVRFSVLFPGPKPPLVSHVQRRRHLDARQVGVPLVCGLGPRLSRRRDHAGRSRPRQASARADAEAAVSALQRAAARLRMEFRRRQPSRARLGDAVPVPHGPGDARSRRRRVPQACVPQAPDQLHVVGESQGSPGEERVRRRLSRSRQHRHLRSQRRIYRPAAISSRPTAPRGWPCSARTCSRSRSSSPNTIPVTTTWCSSSRSTSCGSAWP